MNGDSAGRFEVADLTERHAASIREVVPVAEASVFLSHSLPELWGEVRDQKRRVLAPPFVRYHGVVDGELDIEAGIMISKPAEGRGRVRASSLPGGEAATTWHEGAYETLGATRQALQDWIEEHGLEPVAPHWEVYWTNAGSTDDVTKWRTQLVWPVRRPPEDASD